MRCVSEKSGTERERELISREKERVQWKRERFCVKKWLQDACCCEKGSFCVMRKRERERKCAEIQWDNEDKW